MTIEAQKLAVDSRPGSHDDADKQISVRDSATVDERRLMRKIDLLVVPPLCILYLLAFLDRVNIANARLYNLEADLGLVGNQYNIVLVIFFVPYCLFEIPANLLLKYFRPSIWRTPPIVVDLTYNSAFDNVLFWAGDDVAGCDVQFFRSVSSKIFPGPVRGRRFSGIFKRCQINFRGVFIYCRCGIRAPRRRGDSRFSFLRQHSPVLLAVSWRQQLEV